MFVRVFATHQSACVDLASPVPTLPASLDAGRGRPVPANARPPLQAVRPGRATSTKSRPVRTVSGRRPPIISDDEADGVPSSGREKAVHGDNGNQKPSQFAAFARGSSEWKSQKGPAGMIDEHENSQVLPVRKRRPADCNQPSTLPITLHDRPGVRSQGAVPVGSEGAVAR